ncbi:nuclear transport factor 2 family protein [Streptomyces laculatispora]|uniref:nuclear transport factor 2 family protein n=1 Tax=Streptomyces laculatispora TaxID=887464 RepID=UPI001A951700|nr:nuclear transport factor 2 family protein [Streptomyces laculatispora]MBO0917187.1 nuclear transport factor 2 family protein [Streptomyces laculatispora]
MAVVTPTTTRAAVEELLRRIGEGDPERIAEVYAERVDWKLDWPEAEHGRTATPWIRHRSTRAEAAAHFRELAEHHVPGSAATEIERILVDGDDAVVIGEIRQTARSTGRAYRARFALHLTVEHGLVTRHHVYEDSLAVAQAFEVQGPDADPAPSGA